MGRSLPAFFGGVCALLIGSAAWAANSPAAFRQCLEQTAASNDAECLVTQRAVAATQGNDTISEGLFRAILPTNRRFDMVIKFTQPGCYVWDHRASFPGSGEPGNTSEPVEIVKITAPAGVVTGSKIRFENACIEEYRDGAPGGGATTIVKGVVVEGAGAANVDVSFTGTGRFRLSSGGDGTAMFEGVDRAELDVRMFGATGDGVTDDAAAFNAAVASACGLVAPRTIKIPAGSYALGRNDPNYVYSGMRVTCDDVLITGAGPDSKLHPAGDNGNYAIFICRGVTERSRDCVPTLRNVEIRNLWIEDTDPEAHGHQHYSIVDEGSLSGAGTPQFGDTCTWSGGAGSVQSYSGGQIRIDITSGSISGAVTITDDGGQWTATGATLVAGPTTEESHGIGMSYVDGVTIENVYLRNISDESIDLLINSKNVTLRGIDADGCSQVNAGGSCVSVGDGSSALIDGGVLRGGNGSVTYTGAVLAVETNNSLNPGTAIERLTVVGTQIIEEDTTDADTIEDGIQLAANQADMNDLIFQSMQVQVDNGFTRAVNASGPNAVTAKYFDSVLRGPVTLSQTQDHRFYNVDWSSDIAQAYGFFSFREIHGGTFSAPNVSTGVIRALLKGTKIIDATVTVSGRRCIDIAASASYSIVTGILCDACNGASTGHCVYEEANTSNNLITDNVFINNAAGAGFLIRDDVPTGQECLPFGSSDNSTYCERNQVEN